MPSPHSSSIAVVHTSLVNASLGVSLGIHTQLHVQDVLGAVTFPPPLGVPANADEYQAAFRDACHGKEVPSTVSPAHKVRLGSPHLFKTMLASHCIRAGKARYVSQVVGWRDFYGCLSDTDKVRFDLLTSTPPDARDPVWSRLSSLSLTERSKRQFQPSSESGWLSKPVHWWSPRGEIERILRSTAPNLWADRLRDRLGLYYAEFDSGGTSAARMKNLRFMLHVPASVLVRKGHFRPNFADAGGYRRFAVHRSTRLPKSPQAWGMTADLEAMGFGKLRNGLKERVTSSLRREDFDGHPIEFDYLGELSSPRGHTSVDDDVAFEKRLHIVHQKISPSSDPRLASLVASLPTMLS